MARLDDNTIQQALTGLRDWTYSDGALRRTISFPSFPASVAFVNRVAVLAEQAGHHPDMMINYNKVTLTLSTHDAGGVTDKDLDLAGRIDAAAASG